MLTDPLLLKFVKEVLVNESFSLEHTYIFVRDKIILSPADI